MAIKNSRKTQKEISISKITISCCFAMMKTRSFGCVRGIYLFVYCASSGDGFNMCARKKKDVEEKYGTLNGVIKIVL
jgi:hypothetical protein